MTFSQLAQTLKPFYVGEMTVPEFAKKLLLQITDNLDAVLKYKRKKEVKERDDKTFSSYYYGKKPITPIAKKIAGTHIKRDKFLSFLKSKEFDTGIKEELCKAFENHIPNKKLNIDNIFNTIADEYESIIKSSASNFDTRQAIPTVDIKEVTVSETIREIEIDDVKTFMKELQKAIHNLQDIGHQIASKVSNMKAAEDHKLPEYFLPAEVKSAIHRELINRTGLYPELKSEYNKFEKLYNSIDQYNIEHNEKILTEALKLIANIKIDDFIEKWREATIKSRNNQYIIELNSLIQNYFDGNSK